MAPSNVAANLCKNCNARPVFVDNGRAHDFCGRRCAGEFMKKGGQAGVPSPMQVSSSQSGQPVQAPAASLMTDPALGIPSPLSPPINTAAGVPAPANNGGIPCALSTCNRPAFTGSQFCGQKHREQAVRLGEVEACLLCSKYPKNMINNKLSDFCSRQCGQDTIRSALVILPLHVTE